MRYGRDKAAAKALDVAEDGTEEGWLAGVGDPGITDPAVGPEMLWDVPCFGPCCLRSCSAFASAFSCVRTKWARFYRSIY